MNDARDDDTGSSITDHGRLPPGVRLAAAREEQQLSIAAVAEELKLDPGVIEALESDDRSVLPAAIFVQGYLRRYARLTGLPEDELVRDYADSTEDLPPLTVVSVERKTPFFRLPSARVLRNIILLLLAVILVWLAYPFVERIITSRGESGEGPAPGRLELPPANQLTLPQQSQQ